MQVNLTKGVMTVGFWTLLSRILGMVREILLSALIGAGPLLDAFVVAFRLPNIFRRFFAEGAFNAAFVPLFAKRYESKMAPNDFANNVFSNLLTLLLILTSIAMIFMPVLVFLTAAGFASDERFDLTVEFGRIMFPYILLISLAALFSGVLNTTGRFAVAAATPVILNVIIVAALLIAWITESNLIVWLVYSIPIAGVLQLSLLWMATFKSGIKITLAFPRWNKDIVTLVKIAIPAALAGGVLQINLLVGQLVASQETGAISFLYFADRLYQLPLGIGGIAIGTVLLPKL
ncbi:MAG: murein biosynthesis integral membrane protein MurJ, partial [Paracoccaceae bacterium]